MTEPEFFWSFGILVSVFLAVVGHLYKRISEVQTLADKAVKEQFDDMRDALEPRFVEISRQLEESRTTRYAMVQSMVTRTELDKQIDRVLAAIRSPGRRVPGHD